MNQEISDENNSDSDNLLEKKVESKDEDTEVKMSIKKTDIVFIS